MKIAHLGPQGSFSEAAAQTAFPNDDLLPQKTIIHAILALEKDEADFAVVPIENSIEGSVTQTVDYLFHKTELSAVAELILPVHHQLLATAKTKKIEQIYSHPQALAQTRVFLRENYPQAQLEVVDSTAAGAEYVANHPEENCAAIAPIGAQKCYKLQILQENIEDVSDNYTRFWVLGKSAPDLNLTEKSSKTSVALTLPSNLPGALHKALSSLAWRDINMTKIESRPLRTQLGEYFFIIDLEENPQIKYALEELESLNITARLLGKYKVYQL